VIATDLASLEGREGELTWWGRAAVWGLLSDGAWRGWCDYWNRRHVPLSRVDDFLRGEAGIPRVQGAGDSAELRSLARLSVMNVCSVVVDTFARGLSVTGFRSPNAADDDPAWSLWQAEGLDARQHEVHRDAIAFGEAYGSVLTDSTGGGLRIDLWSPLTSNLIWGEERAFPRAFLGWRFTPDEPGVVARGVMVDERVTQEIAFVIDDPAAQDRTGGATGVIATGEPVPHGATWQGRPVCPVVRFTNDADARGAVHGEVEPIIANQCAINETNYDRLVASRFAAFRQKVILGWTGTPTEQLRASASSVLAFEDGPGDVDVKTLESSPLAPYNELLREMKEQVALQAGIPLYTATGNLSNVSSETVAMIEGAYQRKLTLKRESFGESWERLLRLAVSMSGGEPPDDAAETVWRDSESRSFGAIVDGITKLAQVGIPIEGLLDLVPGMTQQRADAIRSSMTMATGRSLVDSLLGAPQAP
jgi:hypothetical protein